MSNSITEVGVGVVIAILLIREVIPFFVRMVNDRNGKNGKINTCVTRAEFNECMRGVQQKANCEEIVKRIDGGLLALNEGQKENRNRIDGHFREVKDLIRGLPQ